MLVLNPLLPPFSLCSYERSVSPTAGCRARAAHQRGVRTAQRLLCLLDFAPRRKWHRERHEIISVPEIQQCLQILSFYQSEGPVIENSSS